MTWQNFLFDYLVVGVVIFFAGLIARKATGQLIRPNSGWTLCFIGVTLLWPISAGGFLVACYKFVRGLWRTRSV